MRIYTIWFLTLLMAISLMNGCKDDDSSSWETIAPTVVSVIPADTVTSVATNRSILATFSEDMNAATITDATFTLTITGGASVTGVVTYKDKIATFNPTQDDLAISTPYTATITTGAKDLAGNALAVAKTWTFTTGAAQDGTAPNVLSTIPVDISTGVAINANIIATFDEPIDPATLTTTTFTLTPTAGGASVAGVVTSLTIDLGTVATFNPTSNLLAGTSYTATITIGAKDLAGNAAVAYTWIFTTGTATVLGPDPVILGKAGNYVILTETGVTTIGSTHITGDIGVSPIAATAITGFGLIMDGTNTFSTSSLVTGSIYAATYTEPTPTNLTIAIGDMHLAYTDAAGRSIPDFTELGAGDISAKTLVPGLYKWGTGVSIDNRGVTLSGGANDVWIFQIGQDLTIASGAIITLGGSAQAKNIFWQVAGNATLGTTADFKGILLCQTAINLTTGATVNGRLFAQTEVTLQANTVTEPVE